VTVTPGSTAPEASRTTPAIDAWAKATPGISIATQNQLNRGKRLVEILKQDLFQPLPFSKQILIIFAGTGGFLDDMPVEQIREFEKDRLIAWTILGQIRPQIGHVYGYRLEPSDDGKTIVTSFYDWSGIDPEWRKANIFPVIPESALRATLGILDRTVRRGYPRG